MLRYFTSGESDGEALVAFLSGLPAGLVVDQAFVDRELWRRQQGFGRGGRMKIENDRAHFFSDRPWWRFFPGCPPGSWSIRHLWTANSGAASRALDAAGA